MPQKKGSEQLRQLKKHKNNKLLRVAGWVCSSSCVALLQKCKLRIRGGCVAVHRGGVGPTRLYGASLRLGGKRRRLHVFFNFFCTSIRFKGSVEGSIIASQRRFPDFYRKQALKA